MEEEASDVLPLKWRFSWLWMLATMVDLVSDLSLAGCKTASVIRESDLLSISLLLGTFHLTIL
jgi:hypothetical protein